MSLLLTAIAILLTLLFLWVKRARTPPKELQSIPSFFTSWKHVKEFIIDQQTFEERRRKYPETKDVPLSLSVSLNRWSIFVADPELAKEVFINTESFPKFQISDDNPDLLMSQLFGKNILTSNGSEWRRLSKIISPAFQTKNLSKIVNNSFVPCVETLLSQWKLLEKSNPSSSISVDVHNWMQRFTLDVMATAGFSFDLASLLNPEAEYVSVYNRVFKGLFHPVLFFFPWVGRLPIPFSRRLRNDLEKFNDIIYTIIESRRKKTQEAGEGGKGEGGSGSDPTPVDLLDLMIRSSEELSDKELHDNLAIFFIAGHDTTAASLSVVLYFLAKYPEVQERARQEVKDLYSEKHLGVAEASYIPTFDDQKGFEYITACIKEAVRIYPPIIVLPSRVTSSRTKLGGVELPKGTIVKVNIFEIHRSSKVWGPDSEVFLPERFLPEQHPLARDMEGLGLGSGFTPTRNPHPYAFIPFGANQRICIGQQFSLIEQRVLLGALLLRYNFLLPAGVKELTIDTRALLSPKDLFIEFSRRL